MAECKHEFIGNADGVKCLKCGKTMTPKQYQDYLEPKKKKTDDKPAK